ncbi:MAG: YezD family protein [Puniceicoccales bacterium]|jgi:hypothetical protein|nr:YezD family protein [Puniceicoccales bacterium]
MSSDIPEVKPAPDASPQPLTQPWLNIVQAKVEALRYGVVQVIVHDGKVTQIEHTEKTRLVPSKDH